MNRGKTKKAEFRVGEVFDNLIVVDNCSKEDKVKCFCRLTTTTIEIDKSDLLIRKAKVVSVTRARIAEIGEQSGKLTVIGNETRYGKGKQLLVKVQCDCGNVKHVRNLDFIYGKSKSCGCLQKIQSKNFNAKHGLYKTKEYQTWLRIKTACFNENNRSFKQYGGAGIKMYPAWIDSFQTFYDDVGPCPKHLKNPTITRIDTSDGFFPHNCCWLSREEYIRLITLVKCGINPKLLLQPRTVRLPKEIDAISKNIIAAIRKEHTSGESNISILSQKYGVSSNEILKILIFDS
jgi:hypothetical protein